MKAIEMLNDVLDNTLPPYELSLKGNDFNDFSGQFKSLHDDSGNGELVVVAYGGHLIQVKKK
jgi:hypothetical protein